MGKFCKDCIHWEFIYESHGDHMGLCKDVMVPFKVMIDRDDDYDGKSIHTERYFGCIYWRDNDGVATKLPDADELLNDDE